MPSQSPSSDRYPPPDNSPPVYILSMTSYGEVQHRANVTEKMVDSMGTTELQLRNEGNLDQRQSEPAEPGDNYQHLNVFIVVRGPELNTVFKVRAHLMEKDKKQNQ
ncbi:hypothetical protein QYF61_019296 [Mycteria americana]|uniref:Uncharacterized protein n=1 Tax=Mycteria americana TaxID=33587 RepID=A0AAN7NSZ2_MYCAM|nr:hypothetical protein QYF61_019296 [Mycteria americana]